jgi:hypothetical protein
MGNIVRQARDASVALGALAAGGGLLTKSFLDSASQMQQFEATLTAVTGSAAAAKEQLKQMSDFAAKTPFELPSVVEAGVKIKSLGVDVDKFLPLAGNLAAVMGRDIPDAAQALAKAASGSQDGITQLQDSFGVTKRELIAAGAAMGEAGAVSVKTAGDIDRLQAALVKVVGTKFGGAMEAQSKTLKGAFSNLSDAVGQLKADLGEALAPAAEQLARSLTKVVEGLRALPDWVKSTVAFGTVAATSMLAFGAACAGAVAVLGPMVAQARLLASKFPVLTEAVGGAGVAGVALSAAFVATTTAVVALGAAAAVYITILEQQNKATEALLQTELKRADGLRKHHELLGKSADELKRQGATAKDVAEMIMGYQEEAERARRDHDAAGEQRAIAEIRRLKEIQSQFATSEADKRAEVAKTKAAEDAAEEAAKEFKKNRSAGVFESHKAELEAMDAVLAGLNKQSETYKDLARERIKLEREVNKDADEQTKKAHKEHLDLAKKRAELLGAQSKDNAQAEIDALKDILEQFKLTEEEKLGIQTEIASKEEALRAKKAEAEKKAAADRKKLADDQAEAAIKLLRAQEQQAEADVKATEERLHRGENVLEQLKREIVARDELKKRILDAESAKSKADKPAQAGEIDKANAEAKRAQDKETATEQEKLDRQAAERRTKDAAEEAATVEREAKLREELAQREFERTGRGHDEYLKRLRERQRLEQEALKSKEAEAMLGKTAEESQRIQRDYNVQLAELRLRQTDELKAANKELDKAKGSTKEMTGAVISVEEMAKQSSDSWNAKAVFGPSASGAPGLPGAPGAPGLPAPPVISTQGGSMAPGVAGASPMGAQGSAGGGDLVDLMRQAVGYLAKLAGGGNSPGPSPTQFGDYTTTTNRCF